MKFGHRVVAIACLTIGTIAGAGAAVTKTVVDLPSAQGTMRFLHVRPDAPIATIVALGGGDGIMGILANGDVANFVGACNLLYRNLDRFAARGIAIVLVNERYPNALLIVDWLRAREAIPIWIGGSSLGAQAGADLAVQAQATAPVGAIFIAPASASGSNITGPALVARHAEDPVAGNAGQGVYDSLVSASVREQALFIGGGSLPCGAHLLGDLEAEFTDVVGDFIDKYNPTISPPPPPPPPPVPVPGEVIEYFHAGFGHYFTTALADEITLLDGGAFGGAFARTGRSFKAWATAEAGTEPVCRFYTVTFAPKSSHFYTAYPFECDIVKTNPDWQYEGIAYHSRLPVAGACPAGTEPVYRMFNNGLSGAPNHRFTTDLALYQQFTTTMGWAGEGIVFCAKL